jgi:cell wall-associated NlpC family hydrolase
VVRGLIGAVLAALAVAPAASAGDWAKVLAADGRVLARADGPSFAYPDDGSLVQVGGATVDPGGVTLTDVSLLGSQVHIGQVYVPANGAKVQLTGVAAAGKLLTPSANTLVQLGPLGYVVLAQKAVANGELGRLGVRLVLQAPAFGSAAGTQVLVGIPAAAAAAPQRPFDPLSVLGFSFGQVRAVDFVPPGGGGPGSLGARAVMLAENFIGVPYVWGGADPLTGFDCSGLAMYVYDQLGVSLTHYTGAQYNEGLRLPRDQLRAGDLVFFDQNPTLGPQHEGIYIGDDEFIQAPQTGDVVKISSLADPRYGFRYVGAVRPYVAPS